MPYKIHAVVFDADAQAGTPVVIPDCTSQGIDNNPQLDAAINAGEIQPKHVALIGQSATANFSTFALPTAIDETGLKAMCIATADEPGVYFYLQKHDACGGVTTGSVHRSLLISAGVVVPRRIRCDHQGHAQIDYDVVIIKEAGNNAIIISDTADMPTIPEAAGGRWTLGTCKVGNISLTDYTSLEIDLGNQVVTRGVQSDVWDAYVEVRTHAPTITLRGIDPNWFKATGGVTIDGLACTHANTIIYLRHRSSDGTGFVASATETHVKFTAAGLATVNQVMSGDPTRFSETAIQITCLDDQTNDPIVIDTSSAIA